MMLLRKIFYLLGPNARRLARQVYYLPYDLVTSFTRKPLVPPRGINFTGAGDFVAIGNKFAGLAKAECELSPHSRVLDIGSGLGRIARPLTRILNNSGHYEAFDVVPAGVKWCKNQYQAYNNFHFRFIPLKNDLYNREPKEAKDFVFPYPNNSFHLVFSISVFTHMQPGDVRQYLRETARVLKAQQYMIATFFVISNNQSEQERNKSNAMFPVCCGGYYLHHAKVKDANVAFEIDALSTLIQEAGLKIVRNFPGWWSDESKRNERFDYQDVLILKAPDVSTS